MMKYLLVPKKKNILVTGASGFIGRHLSASLEKKYNVFNMVKHKKHEGVTNKIVLDLKNKKQVREYFKRFTKKYHIAAIVNLASRLASADKLSDMSVFYDNIKMIEGVAEIAKLLQPRKLINLSSIAVYPNRSGTYNESAEIRTAHNSECLYGLSKFCSENILDYLLKGTNVDIVHLRLAQVYGDGMREDRVMSVMKRELQKNNRVTVYGAGKRRSAFIYIDKLVKIIQHFIKDNSNGIVNVGWENISYLGLARRIIQRYGNNKSRIIKTDKGSRAQFYLDITKMKKIIK